jgi:hypothetical protein
MQDAAVEQPEVAPEVAPEVLQDGQPDERGALTDLVAEVGADVGAGAGDAAAAAQKLAAAELAKIYQAMPGVVAELISGNTIAEVQAAYANAQAVYTSVKAQVLGDLGAALPGGRAGAGAPPIPDTAFGKIQAGIQQTGK